MKKYPHLENCDCGNGARVLEPSHKWYVKAKDYHNCFYTYIRHNGRPHTLNEIGKLLNLSISGVTSIEKKALDKVFKRLKILHKKKNK